jgi:hypothetical protein
MKREGKGVPPRSRSTPLFSKSPRFISRNGTSAPASSIWGTSSKGTAVRAARSVFTSDETSSASPVPVQAVSVIHIHWLAKVPRISSRKWPIAV